MYTVMEVEALITAVQKRQSLYNKQDNDYSNRVYINEQWKEVAEEVGTDETTARKKWSVLRDSFRRHHKIAATAKSGPGSKNPKRWYLYNRMLFLLPFTTPIDTSANLTDEPTKEEILDDDYLYSSLSLEEDTSSQPASPPSATIDRSTCTCNLQDDSLSGPSTSTTPTQSLKILHPSKKRPKYSEERRGTLSPYDEEIILDALQQMQEKNTKPKTTDDDDELFLRSLLPVLKMLDPISKLECRGELNSTVLKFLRRFKSEEQDN